MKIPNNFWGFKLPLNMSEFPITSKRFANVNSKYSDVTYSTPMRVVYDMLKCWESIREDESLGAVGSVSNINVAEINYENQTYIVAHNTTTGRVFGTIFDTVCKSIYEYEYKASVKSPLTLAVFLVLIPQLCKDDEFMFCYSIFADKSYDTEKRQEAFAKICDNVYRRLSQSQQAVDAKMNILFKMPTSLVLPSISKSDIEMGLFAPVEVHAGKFSVLAGKFSVLSPKSRPVASAEIEVEVKPLNPKRVYTADELLLIPEIPDYYVMPEDIVFSQSHMIESNLVRNIMLRGPAGTGKTEGSQALANILHLPYMKYTCSANTEIFDLIGQMIPCTDEITDLKFEEILEKFKLPSINDIMFDTETAYKNIIGKSPIKADYTDMLSEIFGFITRTYLPELNTGEKVPYKYVTTDFIEALKNGYLVEIQEPTVIMQPGVLVGLNSLLEQNGYITLLNGETIKRHPDTVVVITTNVEYEGCRGLNQSVIDRMNIVIDMDTPDVAIMVERVAKKIDFNDRELLKKMAECVEKISEVCYERRISDGVCGMRSLIDWAISTKITKNPYFSALKTVLPKISSIKEERDTILRECIQPLFSIF